MAIPDNDNKALALTMIGEARNQGSIGMTAVGHTVMNRVTDPKWWGHTIREVCLKPYQYSCWNVGDPNFNYLTGLPESDPLFVEATNIANGLISDELQDFTDGATHYKVIGTSASWDPDDELEPCYTYRQHEFFNDVP